MATITKLPSGSSRVQVRRKGKYVSETFLRRGDAEPWGRSVESRIDRGEPLHACRDANATCGDLVKLHRKDLTKVGKAPGRCVIPAFVGAMFSPELNRPRFAGGNLVYAGDPH